MFTSSSVKSNVVDLGVGGRRVDVPQLTSNFLSANTIVRFRNELYLYNDTTGLWCKKSKEEVKRMASRMLPEDDLSLWTSKTAQNVYEQLDIRIEDLYYNEKIYKNRLALKNYIVNLRTGETVKYSPKYFFTSKSNFNYDANADCPLFRRYLNTVCEGKRDMILMLEELLGYLLTNQTKIQSIFYFYGSGSNGKSVFLDIVKNLVGTDNFITLTPTQIESAFSRSALENKKVLLIGDMSQKDSYNFITAEVKKLSGGDMISAEQKYGAVYQFKPFVKVVVSSNFLPLSLNDSTHGAKRRIFLIPFNHQIQEEEADLSLTNKLKNELPGILNLAMKGLKRLIKNKYCFSFDGKKACREVMSREYPLRSFAKEMIVPKIGSSATYTEIKQAYKKWCEQKKIDCIEPDSKQIRKEAAGICNNTRPFHRNGQRGIDNVLLK